MNEKIEISEITLGMFVSELDRPWIDTPFQLQGFIIDSQEQVELLQQHCKFVYIDRQRSVGAAYRAREEETAGQQLGRVPRSPMALQASVASTEEPKFTGLLASLKAIWAAAFGAGSSASDTHGSGSRGQHLGARGVASGIYMEYVRPDIRKRPGITEAEEAHLMGGLSSQRSGIQLESGSGFIAWLARLFGFPSRKMYGATALEAVSLDSEDKPPVYADQTTFEKELTKAAEARKRSEEAISTIVRDIRENKPLPLETAEEAVAWMVESIVRNPDSLSWLVRLKSHNHYTYDHALNVSVYLLNFGRHLGLPKIILQMLGTAGLLQDLGKVKVPTELLEKRTALTPEECEVLKAHVSHSIEILCNSRNVSPMLLEIVAQHHERHDGSGYPYGLKGDQISMFGAMAGIVDAFVAMTSARPYGDPIPAQDAMQQLFGWRDKAFSTEVVHEFIKCIGVFPVGTLVELNTGEAAVVVAHDRMHRRFPRIMLILDSMKKPYAKPMMLDLMLRPPTPRGEPYRIVRGLHADVAGVDLSALSFAQDMITS